MFARKSALADVPWETFARSSSSSVSSSIARTTVRATSSAESKSRTVAICWGYRPTLSEVERATSGGRTAQPQPRSVHDAGADRDRDGLGPVVGGQLLEDALEMGLDRVGGDPELGR